MKKSWPSPSNVRMAAASPSLPPPKGSKVRDKDDTCKASGKPGMAPRKSGK